MDKPRFPDKYDWHGCDVVQFNPRKLGGRATVRNTRMDADGVLINYEGGLSVDEIVESFGVIARPSKKSSPSPPPITCRKLLESLAGSQCPGPAEPPPDRT